MPQRRGMDGNAQYPVVRRKRMYGCPRISKSGWQSVPIHSKFEHAVGIEKVHHRETGNRSTPVSQIWGPWSPMQYSWVRDGQSHQPLLKGPEASPGFSCHDTTWVGHPSRGCFGSDTFKPSKCLRWLLQWTCWKFSLALFDNYMILPCKFHMI